MKKILFLLAMTSCLALAIVPADASDYILEIFGNANMDDTIDENDIEYVRGIIGGINEATELADANHDGKIDENDISQIEQIIAGEENELTIVDAMENIVTVKMPVEEVSILSAMTAEAIQVLNAEDMVVGIDESTARENVFLPDLSKLPTIGSSSEPDIESIINMNPDLVVCTGSIGPSADELDDKLDGTNITVVRMDFYKDESMSEEIEKLGYLLNKKAEAKEFIVFYEGYLKLILERINEISGDEWPKVYMESHNDYTAHSKGTGFNTRCSMAGGRNIVAEANLTGGSAGSYPVVDPEWVMEQNPDIIIKNPSKKVISGYGADDSSEMDAIWNSVKKRPELANVSAVKNDKIFIIAAISGGPKVFVCTLYMAKWFHPDLFEDLNPEAVHQEYLSRFLRLNYDLHEHGVFVYPPLEVS